MLTVVDVMSRRMPGRRSPHPSAFDNGQWVFNVGTAPADAGFATLKVTAWCGFAATHFDAGWWHVEAAAGLVLGQHASDVVV